MCQILSLMAAAEGLVAEFSSFANSEEKKRKSNLLKSFPKIGSQMDSFGQIRKKIVIPLLSADSRYFRIYALNDRKTEHFKALLKHDHSSAIADHVKTTGHNIKWDHFDILASGKTDYHCKIKETLFLQEFQPALNANVSSEKLLLY